MKKSVTLNHGSGGKQAHELIVNLFADKFGISEPLTDSAIFSEKGCTIAFTTDSYVVDPLFFPGGNIGKLALCGTVNDLSVSGAVPKYISSSFIIEEGFSVEDLESIIGSMAVEADRADVRIITGDTKVVEKGKCDKLFINTAGTGFLKPEHEHISFGRKICDGDKIIVSGSLGNHAIAVLGARNNLNFSSPVISDCASLNHIIQRVLKESSQVHFMRDLTRGGLAAVLYELVRIIKKDIIINEESVPVDDPVKGLCEVLGFDPFYLANEGKVLFVAGKDEYDKILEILRSDPLSSKASVIGEVTDTNNESVVLNTISGGKRILEIPSGVQLPRIC
jgi:hydrogenase expression/formation protein HypE